MNFSDRFKNFLKLNMQLLNECKFDDFYEEFKYFGCPEPTPLLTNILLNSGVNPTNYFTYIPDNYMCSSDYLIKHLNLVDNNFLKAIGQFAFHNCALLYSVLLPEGCERICMSAFMYCNNLKEVRLPSTLNMIEKFAFHGCSKLTNIKFMGTMEEWKDKVKKNDVRYIFYKVPTRKIECTDGYCSLRI